MTANGPALPAIFPAVDIRSGRCVRLVRGARDAEIRYDEDPVRVALGWVEQGAKFLHVIDLGAALGEADSTRQIREIAARAAVPVQVGGGVRDEGRLAALLDAGVARVMLGTRAFRDPDFLAAAVSRHGPDRILAAMDFEGGRLKISGWEETSPLGVPEALRVVEGAGVRRVLVTATDRDGTFAGPRLDLIRGVLESGRCGVVAAGGIGCVDHVRSVLGIAHPRLEGVVVGRALYEGKVDLREALECARTYQGGRGHVSGEKTIDEILDGMKYDANGLVPAVVQDAADGQVLMVAYMNREAMKRTLESGDTCFWSRSRQEYWVKGATSGNTQKVVRVTIDCDRDCVLVVVRQKGVACHTGKRSCFYREVAKDGTVREIDTNAPIFGG